MEVILEGEVPTKIEKEFFEKCVLFMGKKLITSNHLSSLKVHLSFIPGFIKEKNAFAKCYPIVTTWFTFTTPKIYKIDIEAALSKKQHGISIAHESVHIQQMLYGVLKLPPYYSKVSWGGYELDPSKPEEEQPYEIEALGRQEYLYRCFLEEYEK